MKKIVVSRRRSCGDCADDVEGASQLAGDDGEGGDNYAGVLGSDNVRALARPGHEPRLVDLAAECNQPLRPRGDAGGTGIRKGLGQAPAGRPDASCRRRSDATWIGLAGSPPTGPILAGCAGDARSGIV